MELAYDPVIPLLRIYPEELKSECQRDICIPIFMTAFFPIVRSGTNQSVCGQMNGMCTHGILDSHKKKEILPFVATWVNPEDIMLNERGQTQKDTYHIRCGT